MYSLEESERRSHGSLHLPPEEGEGTGTVIFSLVTSDTARGNTMELHQGRLSLSIEKSFFIYQQIVSRL